MKDDEELANTVNGILLAGFTNVDTPFELPISEAFKDFGPLEIIDFVAQHHGAKAAKQVCQRCGFLYNHEDHRAAAGLPLSR